MFFSCIKKGGYCQKITAGNFSLKSLFLYYLEGWAYQDVIWRQKIFFASSRSRLTETIWNSFLFNIETKERLGGTFLLYFLLVSTKFLRKWDNLSPRQRLISRISLPIPKFGGTTKILQYWPKPAKKMLRIL